jgi:hypothetical protein
MTAAAAITRSWRRPMPDAKGTVIAEAERQVREGEDRLARHLVLIRKLKLSGRHDEAEAAHDLLAALTDTLRAARRHLQIEREGNGIGH